MNSLEQAEDLKAFERRLTEYVSCLQPATGRWRMILIVVSVCTATGAWNWLIDPETQKVSFFTSLWNHPFFTISCITLIGLFFAGIHKRVVAPSIIAARCRTVLAEYNMSCDDDQRCSSNQSQDTGPRVEEWHQSRRADKVHLRRSRSVKTRRGRHRKKMGGSGPRRPSDQNRIGTAPGRAN
ncbi:unnamed protein product [Ranitomeya imitator]|uniref:Nuclear envelope phosphatase-regulatory subunit 1 n=2 Tax=Ranitomeya imitator TaxID=111125 RepID=A0ABN9MK51_9NEOB|nr:unnamed protein product [Ranitomeya imitator]